MIFHGGAGTGKTTLARALCNDMNIEVLELNASLDNRIENVRKEVMNFSTTVFLTSQQKVILLNESSDAKGTSWSNRKGFKQLSFYFHCKLY